MQVQLKMGADGRVYRCGRLLSVALCLLAMGGGWVARAQNNKPTVVSEEPPKPQAAIDAKVPLLTKGLRLADFEGMQIGRAHV